MGWVILRSKRYYVIEKQIDGIRKRTWSGHGEAAVLAEKAHRRQKSDALARRILAKEIDFLARQHDHLVRQIVLEEMAKLGFCYRYREWQRVSRMYKPPAIRQTGGRSDSSRQGEMEGSAEWDHELKVAEIRDDLRSKAVALLSPSDYDGDDVLAKIDRTRKALLEVQMSDVERLVAEQIAVFILLDFVANERNMNIGREDGYIEVQSFWERHHRFANTRLQRSMLFLGRLNSLGIGKSSGQ